MTTEVLLVEDDPILREALAQTLDLAGYRVHAAGSFVASKDLISAGFPGIIVTDIRMPGRDGFHLLDYARGQDGELPVILLTGEGDIPMAVRAMQEGAFDFLEKPCDPKTLLAAVERAARMRGLVMENRALKRRLTRGDHAARMIPGKSLVAQAYRDRLRAVAAAGQPVLVTGPDGANTPKVADVIRRLAGREGQGFERRVSYGLGPSDLAAAFGAVETGTLFLDEIASLPADTQFALLERLEAGSPALVIAGSYRDLAAVPGFNTDLRLQLDAVRVDIPALRDRVEDIPDLFLYYVADIAERSRVPVPAVPDGYLADLMARDWPGNARALMNEATQFVLGLEDPGAEEGLSLAEHMAQVEKTLLVRALQRSGGQASRAAADLRLPRKTFYDKLARHGLRPESFR
ncbi:sigma-54-dependent transcriptional regulator [Mangrovicoccus algicola]|uniref:Sigma-54-dependent Fis family transcriptional regulator n=1 Tax=Mangrovicoccus algicola TaxID=2771008 RepID=A0A8J6YSM4_9RHOB|nr:response regulator [Mangrovicoccus algicola]MBE3637022.1 sigma-54-dependent Fis family transcriptional regulator [Mangrovicoccus algicola]